MVFSERLRQLMAARSWDIPTLQGRFQGSPPSKSTISHWCNGHFLPRPYYARQLCAIFEITPREFGLVDETLDKATTVLAAVDSDSMKRRVFGQILAGLAVDPEALLRVMAGSAVVDVRCLGGLEAETAH